MSSSYSLALPNPTLSIAVNMNYIRASPMVSIWKINLTTGVRRKGRYSEAGFIGTMKNSDLYQ